MLNTIPMTIFLTSEFHVKVDYVNQFFTDLFGYTLDDVPTIAKWLELAYPDETYRIDVSTELKTKMQNAINDNSQVIQMVTFVTCKNKTVKQMSWQGFLLGDRLLGYGLDLTEQKKVEKELIEAKDNAEQNATIVKAMLDNLQDAFFRADINGLFNFINPGALKMYGYSESELIGQPASMLYANKLERDNLIENLRKNGSINDWNGLGLRKDGSTFWVSMNVQFIKDKQEKILGTEGVVRDITDRKNAELEIELNNERLESLLKISQFQTNSNQELLDFALGEAIKLTDSKIGYIYFYNEQTQQFTLNTWSKEVMNECRVLNPETVYDLDKTGCWGEAVRQRKPIIINDYQAENKLKKGTPHGHVQLNKFLTIPVFFDNKIVAVAGVANKQTDYNNSDVRQLTLLMDSVWKISERILLIKDLKIAKEKAEESDRLKTAFLCNMSHEIRTPMNGILGFAGLLKEPHLTDEEQHKYIEIIEKSGDRMLNIINDIVSISKIESGTMDIQLSLININSLFQFVYDLLKLDADNKMLKLSINCTLPEKEAVIKTDNEKLYGILANLVKNAIKYTVSGAIEFGYVKKEDEFEFYVKDTGIGIPNERQDAIFERFIQADITDKMARQGAGLGLTISRAYVEMLGGKIWVESEVDKGSTFFFTLPCNLDNEKNSAIPDSPEN